MIDLPRIDRRRAIQWMLTASAVLTLPRMTLSRGASAAGRGYGTDPNLMRAYKPGDVWPLTFSPEQRQTVAALCDVIVPADSKSPSASQLGVPDFLDERISAPYARQQDDRTVILKGLSWLEAESKHRFHQSFSDLSDAQKQAICDEICFEPNAARRFKEPARFFNLFRDLTMGGFYTTPDGWKDIQYIGNVPLTQFDGPPPDVLKYLRLD